MTQEETLINTLIQMINFKILKNILQHIVMMYEHVLLSFIL